MNIQDQVVENKEIVIDDGSTFNAIGPTSVLRDCRIIIAVPSRALGIRGTIVGGEVIAKKALSGFDWLDAKLEGVSFSGTYTNNRFGNFPPMYKTGRIQECDFSNANLRDALFCNTDIEAMTFPNWPHLTLFNNDKLLSTVSCLERSDRANECLDSMTKYIEEYCDDDVRLDAMVIDCRQIAKREGISLEELQLAASRLEGVAY